MIELKNVRYAFVLGDLHLGIKNNSIEWSEIQLGFLIDFFLKAVDEIGFDPERDILIQMGDWHHVRESTNTRIQEVSIDLARIFSQKFKRGVYVIVGNHDVYYKDRTDVHSLMGFDRMYDNFKIFTDPHQLKINNHRVLMLPWIEDAENLKQAVLQNRAVDYVFCHADVKGAVLNKMTTVGHGLDYSDLAKFKKVYSGHIHIRQHRENLIYVGTPYEMDRGDRGNEKGFYVLDFSQEKVSEQFISNIYSPKHVKYEITELLDLSRAEIQQKFKNNFVDVMIESEFSKNFPMGSFTEMIKDFGQRKVEFFSYSKELKKTKSEVEIDSNYEYNIFKVLEDHLQSSCLTDNFKSQVVEKFKKIYDTLKTNNQYE